MHGDINLRSELGQGTTTTFWIPFNKTQATKLDSHMSKNRYLSAPQNVVENALQNLPSHFIRRTGSGSGAMTPEEEPVQGPVQQEVDRKSVHVLVVEDK